MVSLRTPITWKQLQFTLVALLVVCQLTFLAMVAVQTGASGYNPRIDFTVFWAAARMALDGNAIAAFDWEQLRAAQHVAPGGPEYPWLYPPAFHLAVLPFGLLPFPVAFAAFTLGGLALHALALRAWSAEHYRIALAAPAVLLTLMVGNTSLLMAAALVTALRWRHRPVLAGALLAAMTVKPQLGLLIPVALAAGGAWRLIVWAGLWTVALVVLTFALFGAAYWEAFFRAMWALTADVAASTSSKGPMISWYAFLRELGLAHGTAIAAHGAALAGAGAAVAVVWSRGTENLRLAALCIASLLATPYVLQYDLVFAAVAAMFLMRDGASATRRGSALVALLWAGPLPSWVVPGLEPAHYAAPLLTLALGACVARTIAGRARDATA